MATTDQPGDRDLDRFVTYLRSLLGRPDVFAKVTVSVQKGRLGMVHVDRSYTVEQLPTDTRPLQAR